MRDHFPKLTTVADAASPSLIFRIGAPIVFAGLLVLPPLGRGADAAVALPPGVQAGWDTGRAFHEVTATRERICLNGLWQWQPADVKAEAVPSERWGWLKVPGCWPGITDYMQKDCQTVFAHPSWKEQNLSGVSAAWYQRRFAVPDNWAGRRITVRAEYVNSFAAVDVDGKRAGDIHFPGGEVDITAACLSGTTHTLSLLVVAMPLKGVMLSYTDSASAREVKGSVARRGLCGDVWLVSTPREGRIGDVRTATSVRKKGITFEAGLEGLAAEASYVLRAKVTQDGKTVKEFTSQAFRGSDLKEGRFAFTEKWLPDRLWDTHTPRNTFGLEVSLLDAGKVADTSWTERFGFRELWIEGRDFYLNGTRLCLSAVPLDNAQVSAGLSTYAAARESLERLQSFGINFVYTHNYDCLPGSHLSFAEILRAADDVGMLVSFSQPHFSHYDWQTPDADRTNGYARHAEFYVLAAQNHPSVVMYSMSHNATGYNGDMNPDLIDGIHDARDTWALRNVKQALRAEAIVSRLDPSRIVYHHASGNLSSMHVINFYPNFVPVQELSDWFEHWATAGVKPAFLCEYGAPFTWDWTMYRGWFAGKREFGSAAVPWEFCLAEWNAQFFGDRAFQISDTERSNLRWEAKQLRAGKLWHRWDYPVEVGSSRFEERYPVFAMYLTDNWRAFRTWGVSANSPWEFGHFWKLRDDLNRNARQQLPVDWQDLQRPGFSPDYIAERYERMDLAYERADWVATPAAQALIRNNRPLLGYIAGKPARFTSKDHNFLPGETVEKQLIVINNSREAVSCDCEWSFGGRSSTTPGSPVEIAARGTRPSERFSGSKRVPVAAGQQERIALRFTLPAMLAPGPHELVASFKFSNGETQTDRFAIDVVAAETAGALTPNRGSGTGVPPVRSGTHGRDARATTAAGPERGEGATSRNALATKIALFDPKGETRTLLKDLGIEVADVAPDTDLSAFDTLVVGKAALTVGGAAPDISRVRDGLKVIVFEQTSDVLEKRFGFRVEEYGLRQVFPRIPDHPALAGLTQEQLRDWRGEATILPPHAKLESNPKFNGAPTVTWCGLPVTRLWRCGNRGNVASVLIEKPACGDFLPILDGGFSLQFSPLMEYREGKGMVLFCQADVTGRTEREPAAGILARNLLRYVAGWEPTPRRSVVYAGEPAGKRHLESAGVAATDFTGEKLSPDQVLVIGPGGEKSLADQTGPIADWLKAGGNCLALGLGEDEARSLCPVPVSMKNAEHIASFFDAPTATSAFAGLGPADVHNRDPRELPLVTSGAQVLGDGVLAKAVNLNLIFCQLVPWRFEPATQANLRRTHRQAAFLVSRLLANLGVAGSTPLLERFHTPVDAAKPEQRWLTGFYLDQPQEWDDPYRFFRW